MIEHCSVAYGWQGEELPKRIHWLRMQGQEVPAWHGRDWSEFLTTMHGDRWEFVAAAPLGDRQAVTFGVVAYFRRSLA
ncbi:MAG: hypothetical protein KME20_04120 [Kaiparowitsia implicata GSE-PSE-MK54-09C]|jgi:hypothetical protein|nr:hypothetical protein [Kaiparowitsia implicata GSE-PSE-MK54-09C]